MHASLLLLGNLSEGGELNCPFCRRLVRIPEEGFPVCRLTEYLKEQLAVNRSGDDSSSVKPSKLSGISCLGHNTYVSQESCLNSVNTNTDDETEYFNNPEVVRSLGSVRVWLF